MSSTRGLAPPLDAMGSLGFSSIAVHAGERLRPIDVHPIAAPIYTTVGYEASSAAELDAIFEGARPGYFYARNGNPTCAALEETMARLEGAAAAVSFGSGMAALHASILAAELVAGDTIVSSRDIYGVTLALFRDVLDGLGIRTHYADTRDLAAFEATVTNVKPRAVFVEAISNPLLRVVDLPAIVQTAHAAGALVIVDATFATPRLLTPVAHGADFVVHSSTKYLNGHGDATSGIVAIANAQNTARVRQMSKLVGGILGPFEAYLTLRGIKTLAVRMDRQCASARIVAEHLASHPSVSRVHYPGLASHPDHRVAARLFRNQGGAVVAFEIRNAVKADVLRFMDGLRLCCVAPTVGDVYSQLLYPTIASHRDLTVKQRQELGISEGLVRLSVGLEEPEDLIADLDRALA